MQSTTNLHLIDLLTSILIIATRILRDIARTVAANDTLRTIFAAQDAGARIARVVRLTTLLIRRIQIHGLLPFTPSRPRPAATTPAATPRTQPRLQTGNGDAAFIRRPIPTIVAAITRELHLAAKAMGVTLPESLQTLCLHAAIATAGLDNLEASSLPLPQDEQQDEGQGKHQDEGQPTAPESPSAIPNEHPQTSTWTPIPSKTLEL